MEFKKLEQNKKSKVIICFIFIVLLLITILLTVSKAKYQVTKNVQIVNGKVNYMPYDFKIVEIYKEKDQGGYDEVDEIPTGDYVIDEKESKCMINDTEKDDGAILKTVNGNHTFGNLKRMDKCTLYFRKITTKKVQTSLGELDVQLAVPDFSKTSCLSGCEESTNGLYEVQDGENKSYYFRGTVDNNWVSFAEYYWRIIRINGDGSIRLIYNGTTTNQKDSSTNAVASQVFSVDYYRLSNDAKYVGFMYGPKNNSAGSTLASENYSEATNNSVSSNAKNQLDSWYTTNLMNKQVGEKTAKDYIDTEAGFCGDRTPHTGESASTRDETLSGYGKKKTYYGAYIRLRRRAAPTFDCEKENDLYTVSSAKKGNKALTNPIGLITADEVVFAGGQFNTKNNDYWLTTNSYWTMSPSNFSVNSGISSDGDAFMFEVDSNGKLYSTSVASIPGIRPVINLKADTVFKTLENGKDPGTVDNPYVVQ